MHICRWKLLSHFYVWNQMSVCAASPRTCVHVALANCRTPPSSTLACKNDFFGVISIYLFIFFNFFFFWGGVNLQNSFFWDNQYLFEGGGGLKTLVDSCLSLNAARPQVHFGLVLSFLQEGNNPVGHLCSTFTPRLGSDGCWIIECMEKLSGLSTKMLPHHPHPPRRARQKTLTVLFLLHFNGGWIGGEGEFDKIRNILSFKGLENDIRYGGSTVTWTVSLLDTVYTDYTACCTLITLLTLFTMLTMLSLLSLHCLLCLYTVYIA